MGISTFWVNQRRVSLSLSPSQRVVDLLRRDLSLVGTKEGCREGDCGACMILWGRREGAQTLYRSVNSCLLPAGEIDGSHILTIEGLSTEGTTPVQKALEEAGVVQCGFCSPGFVVALTGFLLNSPRLDSSLAREALGGNLCRCTGYASLGRGIEALCSLWEKGEFEESGRRGLLARMEWLVARKVLPPWVPSLAQALPDPPPPSHRRGALPVGGATDLLVQRETLSSPLFLSRKPSLQGIRRSGEFLSLGGGVNLEEFRLSPLVTDLFPELSTALLSVASPPIRARATLAGNLVNASPIGDLSLILLSLGSSLRLVKGNSRRILPLERFFLAYRKVDLLPGELVERILIPLPTEGSRLFFEKVSRRERLDIASVNLSALLLLKEGHLEEARLAAGGVAPVPLLLSKTSALLLSSPLSPGLIREAGETAKGEVTPIDDVRGSALYKTHLLGRLVAGVLLRLAPEQAPLLENLVLEEKGG